MAITAISTIKTWFETGDFPTQSQFWNWLDSFWHKDDTIPVANVDGLDAILNGKATTESVTTIQNQLNELVAAQVQEIDAAANISYDIPDGKLLIRIVVIPSADLAAFSVGTVNNGSEIMPAVAIAAADPQAIVLNIYSKGGRTIWFNGITSQTTIKIYNQ